MRNKLIAIEGTDCSGKSTQIELLINRLNKVDILIDKFKFPNYDSATGRIIAGPYLGRENYPDTYFEEGAVNVDAKVAGMLFAADRLYNLDKLNDMLKSTHLLLDRYVDSNMAHQGGKILDKKERLETYNWFEKLEYEFLNLPKPDIKVLIYMPREYAKTLKDSRQESPDQHEQSEEYMLLAESAYLEVADLQDYKIINCVRDSKIRTIEDINDEIFEYVVEELKK